MRPIVTARMSYALIDHGESPRRQARPAAWIPKDGAPLTASRLYPASVPTGAVRAYRRDLVVRKHALLPEFRDLRSLVVVFRGDGRIAGRMYDLMPLWVGRFYAHRDAWMRYWEDESVGAPRYDPSEASAEGVASHLGLTASLYDAGIWERHPAQSDAQKEGIFLPCDGGAPIPMTVTLVDNQ
jgi:hypothetical protein